MNGKLTLLLATLTMLPLGSAQQHPDLRSAAEIQKATAANDLVRQNAIQMNDLAGHVQSLDDSRTLINSVAKVFADELPPMWATHSIREQIAKAEYQSATDPASLIPEQRIADAWNNYAHQIGAPSEAIVSAAEIHNLRDGHQATAQFLWRRGSQNIWASPIVYATAPDGNLANGCRALESIRLTWDLANHFENLRSARERLQKGIVVSDSLKQREASPAHGLTHSFLGVRSVPQDPVLTAESHYVQEHGQRQFTQLILTLTNDLFPTPAGS